MYARLLHLLLRLSVRKLRRAWEAALDDPRAVQTERLRDILRRHAACAYGRTHGFSRLDTPDEYRREVPCADYESLSPWINRMRAGDRSVLVDEPVDSFAITSGTTGSPKFIPATRSSILEQHRIHRLWMAGLVDDHPRIPDRFFFTILSPAQEGRTAGGIPYGSASGRRYLDQAVPIRKRHAVPYEAVLVRDYEARAYVTLAFALARPLGLATSVNPSSLVLLAERLGRETAALLDDLGARRLRHAPGLSGAERAGLEPLLRVSPSRLRRLQEIARADGRLTPRAAWPEIAAIATWHGGSAPFYLEQLSALWGPVPTRCLGLRASEGMFSIPLSDRTPEGVLATGGAFLEFLPEGIEPGAETKTETLLAHELETGKRYRLLITTSGGLYRYDLGDIVEATGRLRATPTIAFLHRAGQVLSVTGEKVTEAQAVEAVRRLEGSFPLAGFTLALRLGHPPRYRLAVEPAPGRMVDLAALARAFDAELSRLNIEYESKRASNRLAPPEAEALSCGTYEAYRKRAVEAGRPEGQIKPPHLVRDEAELEKIRCAAGDTTGG